MPTIYLSYDLPSKITTEDEAIAYLSAIAKENRCLAWLYLSKRETVFIDRLGKVTGRRVKKTYDAEVTHMRFN